MTRAQGDHTNQPCTPSVLLSPTLSGSNDVPFGGRGDITWSKYVWNCKKVGQKLAMMQES